MRHVLVPQRLLLVARALLLGLVTAGPASAGVMLSAQANAGLFSFRPSTDEETANYYFSGIGLAGGANAGKSIYATIRGDYYPGSAGRIHLLEEEAAMFSYGAEIGSRLGDVALIALRGGTYIYNLVHQTVADDVDGRWTGTGGGVVLGAVIREKKDGYWLLSLEGETNLVTMIEPEKLAHPIRRIDLIKFGVSFVYSPPDATPGFDKAISDFF